MSLDTSLYKEALIVLGTAGVVVPLVRRLQISAVLGYMLVGMAVGPFGLGQFSGQWPIIAAITIQDTESIKPIAELGVVLLMFMIGLELSLERLWLMRRLVFGLGSAQFLVCALGVYGVALAFGLSSAAAGIVGVALAMSSTAVVLQVLGEEKRLNSPAGRASFGVLLFQDLAVVPVLFAISAMAPGKASGEVSGLFAAIGQALAGVAGIVALGRLVLRPLFRNVARTRSPEFFVAACLLVVIACGVAASAAGLSMALGALVGGLLLAGTEYRRQVEMTIEPFRGLLVGVFLISTGMTLDLHLLVASPGLVIGAALALLMVKALLIAGLGRCFGLTWVQGLQTGLLLGPGGEFGFVIVALAMADTLMGEAAGEFVLLVTALTMAVIPLMSDVGRWLAPRGREAASPDPTLMPPTVNDEVARVIVIGFGRVGQTVVGLLDRHAIPYMAVDRDVDRVVRERRMGRTIVYGDTARPELLKHLQLASARALVVTLDDAEAAGTLVQAARAERPDLLIVARARDARHAADLYRAGASDAVPETIEASLQLSEAVLVDIGVPMGPVIASIHEKREEMQAQIKSMAPDAEVRERGRYRLRDALR